MIRTIMLALVLFPTSATAHAQTLFAPVEYVTGDREWKCHGRCLGTLAINAQFIRLTEQRKTNPRVISRCRSRRSRAPRSGGTHGCQCHLRRGLTAARRDELLVITAKTSILQIFVFKVAKHASDGMQRRSNSPRGKPRTETGAPLSRPPSSRRGCRVSRVGRANMTSGAVRRSGGCITRR